jgi:hypothetical protein
MQYGAIVEMAAQARRDQEEEERAEAWEKTLKYTCVVFLSFVLLSFFFFL